MIKKYLEVREGPENPYVIHCHGPDGWITAESVQALNFYSKPENERLADAVRFNDGGMIRREILQDSNEGIAEKVNMQQMRHQENRYLQSIRKDDKESHKELFENNKACFEDIREQPANSYKIRKRKLDDGSGDS